MNHKAPETRLKLYMHDEHDHTNSGLVLATASCGNDGACVACALIEISDMYSYLLKLQTPKARVADNLNTRFCGI